jgi:cation diffusion facilitator family transporter
MDDSVKKIKVLRFTLIISIVLMVIKFTAYTITHSNAIFTDALESIVNVVAGSFALFSMWYASQPKDKNHPYGHGKIEYFSAGFEGGLILIASIVIIITAVTGFFEPPVIHSIDLGIWLTGFAGFVNYFVGIYLTKSGKKNHSLLMVASGKHLITDTITSIGLVVGLVVVWITGYLWLDNVIAIIFGSIIFKTGYSLIHRSVTGLLDEADIQKIDLIINELEKSRRINWIDIHNLRVLKFGSTLHVDCHITLPWYNSLEETHNEVTLLEKTVRENSGRDVEFFIHADPCIMPDSCTICQIDTCPHRKAEFVKKVKWDSAHLLPNKKHRL